MTEPTVDKPKKRSLFNRPKPRQVQSSAEKAEADFEDSVDFFSRGKEQVALRIAEAERKAAKAERRRSTMSREMSEGSSQGKRRRISHPSERHSSEESTPSKQPESSSSLRKESPSMPDSQEMHGVSPRKSLRKAHISPKLSAAKSPIVNKGYISLSDSDEEETPAPKVQPSPVKAVVADPASDYVDPDEEFPELVLKAKLKREQQQREKEQARLQAATAFQKKTHEVCDDFDEAFDDCEKAKEPPTLRILVTSRIQDTKPLIVRVRLTNRLQDVRKAWCERQQFQGEKMSAEMKDTIFLTWKDRQLYDATSCSSLGLKVDSSGKVLADGAGFADGQLHLMAWTPEFREMCRESDALAAQRAVEPEEVHELKEKKIRLKLTSKDMKPVKLYVKHDTPISQLITAFRSQRDIAADKTILMKFDGDDLEPEQTIAETDLDPDETETIEVYIR